jgi:phage baseplate assembly protein W
MATTRADKSTQRTNRQIIYSDMTVNMDVHPDTGDLFIITNENSIRRALKNLVLTQSYERLYDPLFGGNLKKSLFENATTDVLYTIQQRLENSITNFEPRVTLSSITLSVSDVAGAEGVNILISYSINKIAGQQTLNIFVDRVR